MGKPGSYESSERKRTQGIEKSYYLEEEKSIEIPVVERSNWEEPKPWKLVSSGL